ncbi:MAG TPA: hypothetical protein VN203_07060 [Candidatus Acidoferrum sp.]|nr:hypothetical protein [Candidatus Acidoferrum sp.]
MQAEDKGDVGIAAVADFLGFQGSEPASLLFVEAAGEEIHMVMHVPFRMVGTGKAGRALAAVDVAVSHDKFS